MDLATMLEMFGEEFTLALAIGIGAVLGVIGTFAPRWKWRSQPPTGVEQSSTAGSQRDTQPAHFQPPSTLLAAKALDHLPAHVAVIDGSGRIVASNAAWKKFGEQGGASHEAIDSGVNYLEVCRKSAESAETSSEDRADAKLVHDGLCKLLAGEMDEIFHHYPCHAPTKRQWFQLRAAAMVVPDTDGAGSKRFAVICHEQVTEAQVAHFAMTHRSTQVSEHSKLMSLEEMASGLAHELHQPLMAINTFAGGLLRRIEASSEPIATDLRGPIEKLSKQSMRAQEIIKRMRSLVSKTAFAPATTSMHALAREAIKLIEADPRLASVPVTINSEGECEAMVDAVQIQQVIVNLVRNAIEATQEAGKTGPIIVHLSLACGHVAVRVTDQGKGLSSEQRTRLFQPFFTTKPAGTGLGLLICEKIAQLHGGAITLESTSTQGSTFVLSVPVVQGSSVPSIGGQAACEIKHQPQQPLAA
jgi:signal transduction histidine kinase